VRYEDDRGGSGEHRYHFRTNGRAYLKVCRFNCPPLSKWLFGIPEQDYGILEREAKRDAGRFRQIWINGKGQPNMEQDLKLTLAFIRSLHLSSARALSICITRNLDPCPQCFESTIPT
jgi:hypothetical protein